MGESSGSTHPNVPYFRVGAAALLAIMAASIFYAWFTCVQQTNGQFVYGLDDPYIHLGIAKNFALHGVWGVTEYANSSASSSPLWTALLALTIRIAGDWVMWPFVLGIIFSALATLKMYSEFLKRGLHVTLAVSASVLIFLAGPLHIMPFTGMEHSLQIFLDICFLFWLIDLFGRQSNRKDNLIAVGLPALMCLARYESIFLIILPVALLLWRKEWRIALCLMFGPILGIGGFAFFSHLMGMPPIPNSIVLKGNLPKGTSGSYLLGIYGRVRTLLVSESLSISPLFFGSLVAIAVLKGRALADRTRTLRAVTWCVASVCLLHAAFASFGWFYRYEAYLVVLLALVIVLGWIECLQLKDFGDPVKLSLPMAGLFFTGFCGVQYLLKSQFGPIQFQANMILGSLATGLLTLAFWNPNERKNGWLVRTSLGLLVPLAFLLMIRDRVTESLHKVPLASRDIGTQQIQMSRFIQRYYPNGKTAVNDIGAVSYFSHVHLLDLYGLATDDIRRLKLKHEFNTKSIRQLLTKFQPDVVMVYTTWFPGEMALPANLVPVANWEIPPITTSGSATVTFFAMNPPKAAKVLSELKEFEASLPKEVKVHYLSTKVSKVDVKKVAKELG